MLRLYRIAVIIICSTIVVLFLSGCAIEADAENLPVEEGTFPSVHIEVALPIHREVWGNATVTISNAPDESLFSRIPARIRGRGNSSWERFDKKPFRIRFFEPRTMLCSDHAALDWTFIANHSDKSLLRNYSAYYLASMLDGMYFTPYARFVDVYFNGEYQGVFMLSVQVQAGEGRAELTYNRNPGLSEFLIEMNQRIAFDPRSMEGRTFVHVDSRNFDILYPRGSDLTVAHVDYVRSFLQTVADKIHEQDPALFDYIHLPSFVDFYIVQELFKNLDIGHASVFMQIRGQGDERRLEMGPVWDFDVSAGNTYFQGRNREDNPDREYYPYYYSPHGLWAAWTNHWFRSLMHNQYFFNAVATRWNEIRDAEIWAMMNRINYMAWRYQDSFERNFDRWQIMGEFVWPNPDRVVAIDTFAGQVGYLVEWLEIRIEGFGDFLDMH